MSTNVAAPERVDVESATCASIDVTEASPREVTDFAARNDCAVHFERRGGRTYLVAKVGE